MFIPTSRSPHVRRDTHRTIRRQIHPTHTTTDVRRKPLFHRVSEGEDRGRPFFVPSGWHLFSGTDAVMDHRGVRDGGPDIGVFAFPRTPYLIGRH